MPFPWLAFGIMMALSIGLSAIQYLLRPKPQKGDVFDSKTYHSDGMENSIEIGAPINVPYGVHKIAPQIRSYLSIAKGDDTTIEALCSCGEGVINGIHKVKLNNQSFGSLFGYNYHKNGKVKNGYWVTFGEKIQKVYESCKTVEYDLVGAISSGFNVTVKVNLDYSKEGKFQDASSDEPGYLIIYKKTGIDDNAEIVQYTGKSEAASGLLQFTGCRVTKSHADAEMVKQIYKIKKDSSGNVYETIPGFSKTVVNHQEVGTNVTKSNSVTVTTQNKVEALAVTVGFPEGLYTFDDKGGGYKKAEVEIKIRWWPDGEPWSGDETPVTVTRTQTATNSHYIKLEKKKNYGYLVDVNGDYVEGTESELEQITDWDEIEANDILEFTLGSTTYKCKVAKPAVKVPVDPPRYKWENVDGESQNNPVHRYKVNFKVQEPEQVDKYNGPKADKASYKFTYEEMEKANVFKTTIAPDKAKLSDYRLTFVLPEMERFGALGYKKYKCEVFKLTDDMTDTEKGINKMTFIELQEITIDNLSYPHEALLALKFTTNEKIYGTINNITCITEGRLLKDVQNTSNPDRLSTNFYDFFSDIITNKRYGRGKELNLSSTELTDFYSKLSPEAAFADHSITENSKPRKRFEVNVNVDFKKPTIDLIQALSICARSNIYWDGAKPLAYVDRATTPTAMFGSANIIPGSYQDQTMDLTENVNRIYPQFLNKRNDYTHDSVSRDLRDEGFTINKLRPKSISIYGITDKWRATKTANYLLRFAKYVSRGCQFQLGGDAITIDMGKTFYYINTKGNCGRILAVASNNITLDRAFTLESGKTYKALVRKDDGTPHTELTVDVGTTGLGSKTVIYFTGAISGVTLATNPIYGIGVAGEYYDTYRCVTKNSKGSSYEISGALYNAETYRLYKNDPSSDPSINSDTEETESSPTTLENKSMFPPNIISIKAVEDKNAMGQVSIYITKPISTSWSHAEVYISAEDDNIDQNVGRTTGEPLRITGLKPDIEYTIKAISYAGTISNPTPFESTPLTLEGTEPPRVTGLSIINNRGNETEMFGRDFRVRCAEMSGIKSDEFVRKEYIDEGIRYLWEVYYSGLPDTVKLGNIKASARKAYYEITRQNEFDFTLEENIEATKQLWKNYENVANSSYSTYYGNPQREITVKCWLINAWGRMSPAPAEIELENPAPDMKDSAGVVMTPEVKALKSAIRVKWKHPYKEYDISHFIIKYATDEVFTQNVKRVKVTSLINVDSADADVEAASYKTEIDGLDPKKTYYIKIIPHDTYGAGTASNNISLSPGVSDDDADDDIDPPEQITGVTLSINANNNVVIKWNKPSGSHATDVIETIIDWRASQFTGTPNLTLTPIPPASGSGNIPRLAEVDQGYLDSDNTKLVIGEKQAYKINVDESENFSKNSLIIKGAKVGYTYFVRARFRNSSGKEGSWSAWAYNTVAVTGLSEEDMPIKWAMFKFLGAVTAIDATHVSVSITGGSGSIGIKKKTQSGGTSHYINNMSSTAFTGTKFVVFRGGGTSAGSPATLVLQTEAEMEADSTVQCAIAKVIESVSGKCKVLMMLSAEYFSISAYEGGFNQLSAITADLGEITAGTVTGATIQTAASGSRVILDSSGLRAYNGSTQRVQISNDGSGWLGASNKLYWDTAGNLTVTGVVADSVAAEDIIAGTITGSTLQTASSGKRFVVTTSTNEAEFYGDRGDATIEKLATIGITTTGGDTYIADFGNTNSGNSRHAIRARSYSERAIDITSVSGNCINADSSGSNHTIFSVAAGSGSAIYASSSTGTGYGLYLRGNSTKAPLHMEAVSSAPSSPAEGDIYPNSTDHKLYYYNGTAFKEIAFV